jgi:hypothetical protein
VSRHLTNVSPCLCHPYPTHFSLITPLQIPLLHKPTRKPLNLQSRKHRIQIPLREIVPPFSRSYEHLQLDTPSAIALHRSGGEFSAETVDVVLDEGLESLSCCDGKLASER